MRFNELVEQNGGEPPEWAGKKNGAYRKKKPPKSMFEIKNPNCKVCKMDDRVRMQIDTMLATGWTQVGVMRHWNDILEDDFGPNYFSVNNISSHARRHLTLKETAIKTVIEKRAELLQKAEGEVADYLITKEAVVESVIVAGLQGVVTGATTVEARDLLQAVKDLVGMEKELGGAAQDELWRQFEAFKDAVMLVVPADLHEQIFEQTKVNLEKSQPEAVAHKLIAREAEVVKED